MSSYAIVTGAAKGIGKALARELAEINYELLLIDMDSENLELTAKEIETCYGVTVYTLTLDLSQSNCAEAIFEWSKDYHDKLSIIINNAGYGLNGAFQSMSLDEQMNIIDVNVKAIVSICHKFIPILNEQPKSFLVNVASTTAYQTVPYLNVYASTKAFMLSFTRGLRYELRNSNISVSAVSPGSTDTQFVNRANMGDSIKKTAKRFNMTAEEVAKIAIKGIFKGKIEIIPGFINKLNAFLPKFFPKTFVEKIAGNIYEPKTTVKET